MLQTRCTADDLLDLLHLFHHGGTMTSTWGLPAHGTCLVHAALLLAVLAACSEPRAATDPPVAPAASATPVAPATPIASATPVAPALPIAPATPTAPADAPLAAASRELLELAARAAGAIPVEPHLKDRSRAQEAVFQACLALDQPRLALDCAERIGNWRRGACLADLALHVARRDPAADVAHWLEVAAAIAKRPEPGTEPDDSAQAWRRERILGKLAEVCARLGRPELAERCGADGADGPTVEARELESAGARPEDQAAFDARLATLDAALDSGDLDRVRLALDACARLLDRDHADAARRPQLLHRMDEGWVKLPLAAALDLALGLADTALAHGDRAAALAFADEAQDAMERETWLPEDEVPLRARLAALRARAGETESARAGLLAAVAMFDVERGRIADVFRADALRPVAEAWCALGDSDAARAAYARAIEAGAENPNGRPRAEDLSATCCSMARQGFDPGPELIARMTAVCDGLVAPW
jgi:hypothetical protein